MSKINKILFVILVVVVVISVILCFNKNKKPSVSFLMPVEMVTEKSAGKYYTMDLSYPKSDAKDFPEVYAFATSSAQEFLSEVKNISDSDAEMMHLGGDRLYNLSMDTRVATSSQTITYILSVYTFTGGAHGNTAVATFTYDRYDKLVTLDNVFDKPYLQKIAALSRTHFYNTLGDYANPEMIDPGTEATTTNFSSWYLTDDGITFIFGQYQVGPYVIGMPEFSIGKSDLSDILSLKFK